MHALIVAVVNPDNTPHGYNWTFAFPMILFAVIALILWGLFGRPHHRVPARPISLGPGSRARGAGSSLATAASAGAGGSAAEPQVEPTGTPPTATAEGDEKPTAAESDGGPASDGGSGASE